MAKTMAVRLISYLCSKMLNTLQTYLDIIKPHRILSFCKLTLVAPIRVRRSHARHSKPYGLTFCVSFVLFVDDDGLDVWAMREGCARSHASNVTHVCEWGWGNSIGENGIVDCLHTEHIYIFRWLVQMQICKRIWSTVRHRICVISLFTWTKPISSTPFEVCAR